MPDAGSHQRVVAFLRNSDGIPSKEITLSSLGTPAVTAPRPPKILKIGRDGSTVNVFFQPGDDPVANGIGLALTAANGEVIQDRFTASQMRPFGPLRGIGAARQAHEYEVSIPNVDPTVHIEIAIDGSNDGMLSRTSTVSLRPLVRSISEPRLVSGLRSGRRL